jgi:hypothetical protein
MENKISKIGPLSIKPIFAKKIHSINVGWIFAFVGQIHALIYESVSDGIKIGIFALTQ